MSRKPTTSPAAFAGATDFGADGGYIAPPPREVREQARAGNEAIGFVSDKPRVQTPEASQAGARKRERRASQYPAHYSLRMREEDRDRFDDYAHRHRIPKGEAMQKLLDLAEAEEARQGAAGASTKGKGGD